jgi:hypothetical protein
LAASDSAKRAGRITPAIKDGRNNGWASGSWDPESLIMSPRGPKRRSKSSKDIFAATRRTAVSARKPGRPPVHDEAWTKVTVVLFNRQIVFLDRLAANIRAQSGAAISRAQLIRALLDAVADADVDLTTAMSENDLKATILARLGKYRL